MASSDMPILKRIALGVEYDGTPYFGWQKQQAHPSVQGCLEAALTRIAAHPVQVYCAGRTDRGVHAIGQVVHFDTTAERVDVAWVRGVNTLLPKQISVLWHKGVSTDFHARRSALSRRYCYVIANTPVRRAVRHHRSTWIHAPLEVDLMRDAAQCLVGTHDFTSFRAAECQARSPLRTVTEIHLKRAHETIFLEIKANAFLHHMVRNIVGTLLQVGRLLQPVSWVAEVLQARDRRVAGLTAPPEGLYFLEANYPSIFALPQLNLLNEPGLWG